MSLSSIPSFSRIPIKLRVGVFWRHPAFFPLTTQDFNSYPFQARPGQDRGAREPRENFRYSPSTGSQPCNKSEKAGEKRVLPDESVSRRAALHVPRRPSLGDNSRLEPAPSLARDWPDSYLSPGPGP